jgi:hypothetical protein
LVLTSNKINSLHLENCNSITYLNLNNNPVSDLSFVGALPALASLALSAHPQMPLPASVLLEKGYWRNCIQEAKAYIKNNQSKTL